MQSNIASVNLDSCEAKDESHDKMQYNAHEKPPERLKEIFKRYQKIPLNELDEDGSVLDLGKPQCTNRVTNIRAYDWMDRERLSYGLSKFMNPEGSCSEAIVSTGTLATEIQAFSPCEMPGLVIIPNMLPLNVQGEVLGRIFHRDLQNSVHKTNVHLHYDLHYSTDGESFFSLDPSRHDLISPKDPNIHKPMSVGQFMNKKLRWLTLGGQYDWTSKVYPDGSPPTFPQDLGQLLQGLFPETTPEAAIVNLYSPGDTLSLHRDVSEDCGKGLISISIGCDALFVIGLDETERNGDNSGLRWLAIRLRSGDAVYMSDAARFAWHGVPKIIQNSCPAALRDWPGGSKSSDDSSFSLWQGWMASKRINLNVRQMKE